MAPRRGGSNRGGRGRGRPRYVPEGSNSSSPGQVPPETSGAAASASTVSSSADSHSASARRPTDVLLDESRWDPETRMQYARKFGEFLDSHCKKHGREGLADNFLKAVETFEVEHYRDKSAELPEVVNAYVCRVYMHENVGEAIYPFGEKFEIKDFTDFLSKKRTAGGKLPAISNLGGYRSAFKWAMIQAGRPVSQEWDGFLGGVFTAFNKRNAQAMQDGTAKVTQGKDVLKSGAFKFIAAHAAKTADSSKWVFFHLIWVLQWNLCCRVSNVVGLRHGHMSLFEDGLGFFFGKMKNDQEGQRSNVLRHCYANPLIPEINLLLILGMWFLVSGFQENDDRVFPGSSQAAHYDEIFRKIIGNTLVAKLLLSVFGLIAWMLGTHSSRKGAGTYMSSASIDGPGIVPIHLRLGWKLEGVDGTYLRHANAGDQFCGRTVAMLPLDRWDFATLPPHFPNPDDDVASALETCFPNFPESMRGILTMCLASLVFHRDWMEETLGPKHPARDSPFFTLLDRSVLDRLRAQVVCSPPQPGLRMTATGIPLNITLQGELARMRKEMQMGFDHVLEEMKQQKGQEANQIIEFLRENSIDLNQVTKDELSKELGDMENRLVEKIRGALNIQQPTPTQLPSPSERPAVAPMCLHYWPSKARGGTMVQSAHKVSKSYRLPAGNVRTAFVLWFLEHEQDNQKFPALRTIDTRDLGADSDSADILNKRREFSKLKRLMTVYEEALKELGWGGILPTSAVQVNELWKLVEPVVTAKKKHENRRHGTYQWTSLAKGGVDIDSDALRTHKTSSTRKRSSPAKGNEPQQRPEKRRRSASKGMDDGKAEAVSPTPVWWTQAPLTQASQTLFFQPTASASGAATTGSAATPAAAAAATAPTEATPELAGH